MTCVLTIEDGYVMVSTVWLLCLLNMGPEKALVVQGMSHVCPGKIVREVSQ